MGFNENVRSRSRPHLRDYTRLRLNNFDQCYQFGKQLIQSIRSMAVTRGLFSDQHLVVIWNDWIDLSLIPNVITSSLFCKITMVSEVLDRTPRRNQGDATLCSVANCFTCLIMVW